MDLRSLGETKRLSLRTPEEGELESIVDLWTDVRAMEHTGGPREREVVETFFRETIADPEKLAREEGERWWSVLERSSGRWVGLCSLMDEASGDQVATDGSIDAGLGYFLLPAFWGRGYATEAAGRVLAYAFEDLGLKSVVAIVDPHNAGSAAVASKLGMEVEREAKRADGVVRRVYRLWNPRSCTTEGPCRSVQYVGATAHRMRP